MTPPTIAPYGSWKSPITADQIVAGTIGLGSLTWDGRDIYWLEGRPAEQGRNVLVQLTPEGQQQDITPPGFNVRSRVHEYGGGAYVVHQGIVYFSNFADQRLYRQIIQGTTAATPEPITPAGAFRYADAVVDPQRQRLICVREDHSGQGEAVNTLVGIDLTYGTFQVLAAGTDFYASPQLSPDGSQLCWLSWNHPNMPWDGTELFVAEVNLDGSLGKTKKVAGGLVESIFQPQWSPDGILYFVSDRSNWWNLYRYVLGKTEPLCEMPAEFGVPHWVFGMSTYGFASKDRIICTYTEAGNWYLASLDVPSTELQGIPIPYSSIASVQVSGDCVLFLGSSFTESNAAVKLDLATGDLEILKCSSTLEFDLGYLSVPQPIEFPTSGGKTAYGFFYPPTNVDYQAPKGEKPPLLVKSHGGPTAATSSSLNLKIQYWTSRGFAVLDVNYGGSTGYGREYRQRLQDNWGIVDVEDCANGAQHLTDKGWVDGDRLAISGGSAGGYTTLCALTFKDIFKAGASYYGVSDLAALAQDTHKFEARYLDGLVGPYPKCQEIYRARSPIYAVDQLSCPVIFFQGLEDQVVPPNQTEMMVEALKSKGLPVKYVAFEGEQHGFRKAENIKRTLVEEYRFYGQVFGFTPVIDQ
ncbi:MAG: S9 family peptidase [Microcoleaceae cyanobacterium]